MSPVFRHGSLRLYLLKLLDEAPRHGYEVIRLLQDRFLGVYAPSPGTIYPRLARLEEEGLVTHDEIDGKKVYRITDKGREELHARLDDLARARGRDHGFGPRYRPRSLRGRPGDRPEPARGTRIGRPGHEQTAPRRRRRPAEPDASRVSAAGAAASGGRRGESAGRRPSEAGDVPGAAAQAEDEPEDGSGPAATAAAAAGWGDWPGWAGGPGWGGGLRLGWLAGRGRTLRLAATVTWSGWPGSSPADLRIGRLARPGRQRRTRWPT